jgi:hypothetical protein
MAIRTFNRFVSIGDARILLVRQMIIARLWRLRGRADP